MRSLNVIFITAILMLTVGCMSHSPVSPASDVQSNQNTPTANKGAGVASKTAVKKPAQLSAKQIVLNKIANGAVVFDARSDEEFQKEHYPNAINVPVDLLEPTLPALAYYKDKEIIVYCGSGKRAERLKEGLNKAGFKKVYNAGGLKDILN